MRAGQDLVAAGYAGLAGTSILIKARRQELECRFAADYLTELAEQWTPAVWDISVGAAEGEPVGEGGILTAIWHLTGAYRLGAEFSLRRIPIRQGTIEICEIWGLNPYRLYSAGCWLLTADNGGRLVQSLEGQGIAAAVIGSVTPGIARVISDGGERGFLNRPQPDELERVFPTWKEQMACF